jgi:hypothetical protein
MVCQFCHRELAPLEPIYRLALGRVAGKGTRAALCKGCLDKSGPIWLEEIPVFREQNCEHCGRPVFTPSHWKRNRAICSPKCRGALETSRAKQLRTLRRTERECPIYRRKFTPKRIDGRYCSIACKQAAYRWRLIRYQKETWVDVLKQCPVPMDDIPKRSGGYPKKLDLGKITAT